MSDVEEYFTQMAGTDADKPDATDDAKHDETMGAGQSADVLAAWNARRSGRTTWNGNSGQRSSPCSTTWSADSRANCP